MFLQTIIITVFFFFQAIEDTNGTNILDQSVIKKGRKNNYNAQPRLLLNGLHNTVFYTGMRHFYSLGKYRWSLLVF